MKATLICPKSKFRKKMKKMANRNMRTPLWFTQFWFTFQKKPKFRFKNSIKPSYGLFTKEKAKFTHCCFWNQLFCKYLSWFSHEDRINELEIEDETIKNELMSEIKRRFKTSILKTMAEFSVELKAYEGINGIKRILHAGVEAAK